MSTAQWGHGNAMAQGTVQVTHTGTSRWRRRTGEYASLAAALEAAAEAVSYTHLTLPTKA